MSGRIRSGWTDSNLRLVSRVDKGWTDAHGHDKVAGIRSVLKKRLLAKRLLAKKKSGVVGQGEGDAVAVDEKNSLEIGELGQDLLNVK